MIVRFRKLHPSAVAPHPAHGYTEDAGADLRSVETQYIGIGGTCAVRTALAIELPTGYQGEVRSRSGLAVRGIVVANSPGTIDPGFRGEICVILHNHSDESLLVEPGDRIAQLVITRYEAVDWQEQDELAASVRGESGFGASGVK